jgi:hypothetical protein
VRPEGHFPGGLPAAAFILRRETRQVPASRESSTALFERLFGGVALAHGICKGSLTKVSRHLRELAAVQKELACWTRVALEMLEAPAEVKTLAVRVAPALRVLTPTRRLVASHDGYLTEHELLAWLREQHVKAVAVPEAGVDRCGGFGVAADRLPQPRGQP